MFTELQVFRDLTELMQNERIRPEPEYGCFSKYLATLTDKEFTQGREILNLINAHGVHLRNDVKYWLDKSNDDTCEKNLKQAPVLDPENFVFRDFDEVIDKLKELPSEWTVIQITKKFSLFDIMRKSENDSVPEIHVTRFACGDLAERIHPYSVTISQSSNSQENIFKVLQNLSKMRREYYNLGRTNKALRDAYYKTNSELMSFIKELESYVLGQWMCLFTGRLENDNLEKETLVLVNNLITSYCKKEQIEMPNDVELDVIYQVTLSSHLLKTKDIFGVLKAMIYTNKNYIVNANELMLLVEDIKLLNLSRECAIKRATHNPVILIVDNDFEIVPWEMISPLSGQPVCRISSLHLLYALYKYHQPYIKNGYRIVEIDCTYCLINPSKDLESCEKNMTEFLKKRLPWAEVEIGKAPEGNDLVSKIGDYSAYLYCGHGSGTQYLKVKDLKKAFVKGLILLFGCSSSIPRNCGGRTPHQNNTYTYISNGCPCTIGCIQDVGSADADAACEEMLSNFMPSVSQLEGSESVVLEPKEPNVLKALAAGKNACPKYWSKSAFVARGLPCKTAVGDVNEIKVLRFSLDAP